MDPITHAITGALIGKAFFTECGVSANREHQPPPGQPGRPVLLVTLGALFPDADFIFQVVSKNPVATLEYHRWITHSLVCLPVFALLLAAGAWGRVRWRRGIAAPRIAGTVSFAFAMLLFGAGIASHIFLDVITSWGTMVLAPVSRLRPAWDWVFILDASLTGVLLLPQVLAWIHTDEKKAARRRVWAWLVCSTLAVALQQFSAAVGVPFPYTLLLFFLALLAVVIFGPAWTGRGTRFSTAQWCRAGVGAAAVYLLLCFGAHRVALARVQQFVRQQGIATHSIGALPLPPMLLRWAGMIRTENGVHQAAFSLLDRVPPHFEFIADRATPESLETAKSLREVQTYLWFARFPVVETREEAGQRVVVFTDRRFVQRWASAPAPFEYWVVFDAQGQVVQQGWAQVILLQRAQKN
jgi:membrane-bound metal-dependent hydrolase YbcI (DUF457 family)